MQKQQKQQRFKKKRKQLIEAEKESKQLDFFICIYRIFTLIIGHLILVKKDLTPIERACNFTDDN
jgi:hypothetical protein